MRTPRNLPEQLSLSFGQSSLSASLDSLKSSNIVYIEFNRHVSVNSASASQRLRNDSEILEQILSAAKKLNW